MQKDIQKIKDAGLQVVGVSYDSPEVLKAFAEKSGIEFPLLSDAGSKTIDAYGIRNKEMDGVKYGVKDLTGIPHPGTYIIDKDRKVAAKLFLEKYAQRHTTDELVKAAAALE